MPEPTEQQLQAARSARSSNGYLLFGFVLTFLPFPFDLTALVPLVLSVWGSVRTSRALRRLQAPRGLQVSNGIALALTVGLILTLAVPLMLPGNTDYNNCMSGANTQTAQQVCKDRYHVSDGFWGALVG